MVITNVVPSPVSPAAFTSGLIEPSSNSDGDLFALQNHREALLEKAKNQSDAMAQTGCVSDISSMENVVDRDDYQDLLREVGRLMRGFSEWPSFLDQFNLRADVKVDNYDDSGIFEIYRLGSKTGDIYVEEEAEAIGYLAWLAG